MTLHLHGNILTQYGIAANNRGETEGNITTLQKIVWKGELHSTVSAEAIRFALRYRWQQLFEQTSDSKYETNRNWNETENKFVFKDETFADGGKRFIDDDLLGYMDAKAAAIENEDPVSDSGSDGKKKSGKAKGTNKARRGPLEVTRAVSLLPFLGEASFSAKAGEKGRTSLYGTEMHATAYQYGFSMTPAQLRRPERVELLLDAMVSLGAVGGNHGRFLYDFSPTAAVFRITADPAPRVLYLFEANGTTGVSLGTAIKRVEAGDIRAEELVIAGDLNKSDDIVKLINDGAKFFDGLTQAATYLKALNWR